METIHALVEDDSFGSIDKLLLARRPRRRRAPTAEELKARLEKTLLHPPRALPPKIVERVQQRWDMQVDKSLLFEIDPPDIGTQTIFYRGGRNFQIVDYEEVAAPRDVGGADGAQTGLESSGGSIAAALPLSGVGDVAAAAADAEEQWLQQTVLSSDAAIKARERAAAASAANLQRVVQPAAGGLLAAAPGLERGIQFQDKKKAGREGRKKKESQQLSGETREDEDEEGEVQQEEARTVREDLAAKGESEADEDSEGDDKGEKSVDNEMDEEGADEDVQDDDMTVDELLPVEFPSLQPTGAASGPKKERREWAHMVDLSKGSANFASLAGGADMARTWPFELDAFQKEAIYHLECGDSVFVAAHTSAGKTVVAEYAIALAQKHQTKAIYTSPIKALSNQKFRDFKHEFEDVGILTGDVQINPEAKCLIMTTEILRSKLYGQADLLREVEFVIFDEVHYVSDTERGVVWEEVIIMLPEHVSLILLSATVPNTYEFASWVGRTKRRDVYVISTPKRPVPLEHYLWSGKGVQKIVSADRKWQETGYREAVAASSSSSKTGASAGAAGSAGSSGRGGSSGSGRGVAVRGGPGGRGGGPNGGRGGRGGGRGGGARGGQGTRGGPPRASHMPGHMGRTGGTASLAQDKTLWADVVRYLRKATLLPACIFVFSRARCEEFAQSLGTLDFCDAGEKTRIHALYSRSIMRLAREDQELPQITRLRDLATRGIAVHHGGLLPIAKEIVELLFAQSLVKVLFATETFAVGLNLPTRTVVFSDHRKFDGTRRRVLSPGEYTQMAGRAGRRGLDSVGTAILVPAGEAREMPPAETLRSLILGQPTRLTSQFRLTYNMILSLHRVETLRVEDMMKRSFSENAVQSRRPEHEDRVRALEAELAGLVRERPSCEVCDGEDSGSTAKRPATTAPMAVCHLAAEMFRQDSAQMYDKLARLSHGRDAVSVFGRGRLVAFANEHGVRAVGVVAEDFRIPADAAAATPSVRIVELRPPRAVPDGSDALAFVPALRCFLPPALPRDLLAAASTTSKTAAAGLVRTVSVPLARIEHVANHVLPLDSSLPETAVVQQLAAGDVDLSWDSTAWEDVNLDRVRDVDIVWYVDDRRAKAQSVASSGALACPQFVEHYALRHEEWAVQDRLATLRRSMDDSTLALLPEYQNRLAVLKHLGFVNASAVVLLKGRVACEVRTADSLVLTETILNNLLAELEPAAIAALLSVFVYQGKDDTDLEAAPVISAEITRGLTEVYRIRKEVVRTQEQFHVLSAGDEVESASRLHFGLMEVVYEWASGSPFKTIAGMTTEQEGTIVRTITRLEETCREVRNIGRIIGDTTLETKMNGVKEAIMRNITTVPSLYL